MAYTGPKVFYIILTILLCGVVTAGGVLCAVPVFDMATAKKSKFDKTLKHIPGPFPEMQIQVPLIKVSLMDINYTYTKSLKYASRKEVDSDKYYKFEKPIK